MTKIAVEIDLGNREVTMDELIELYSQEDKEGNRREGYIEIDDSWLKHAGKLICDLPVLKLIGIIDEETGEIVSSSPKVKNAASEKEEWTEICFLIPHKYLNRGAMMPVVWNEELHTIIAALRLYQSMGCGDPENRSDDIHELATNGGDVISLNDDGIDELCERINTEAIKL